MAKALFTTPEVKRTRLVHGLVGCAVGAFTCLVLLMATGQTGGSYWREQIAKERAEQAQYQADCEGTVQDALDTVDRATELLSQR